MAEIGAITVEKLRWFLRENVNLLLKGKHGVGKTSMIRQAFMEEHINYRIYSAATMDPWVDFIGVPRAVPNGHGVMKRGCEHIINPNQVLPFCLICGAPLFTSVDDEMVLKMARPAEWAHDEVEAIFFDEYNRAHKKIRNAVMELIQFKSINDRKFPNLKVVWAAINPDDDEELEYDVEPIDPAQLDRFHVHLDLPYKPSRMYFREKFGNEIADTAINWWQGLPEGANGGTNIKNLVSPRRLDYAIEIWKKGGHLEDVLPEASNVSALRNALKTTPVMEELLKHFTALRESREAIAAGVAPSVPVQELESATSQFLANENNYGMVIKTIVGKPTMISILVPLIPQEKIADLLINEQMVRQYYLRKMGESPVVLKIMQEIAESNTNTTVSRDISRALQRAQLDQVKALGNQRTLNPNRTANYFAMATNPKFETVLDGMKNIPLDNTYARISAFTRIEDQIPAEMTLAEALSCMTILNTLVLSSHRNTIDKWVHLVGMVNTCIENMIKANWDFADFAKKFRKLAEYLINVDGFYFSIL